MMKKKGNKPQPQPGDSQSAAPQGGAREPGYGGDQASTSSSQPEQRRGTERPFQGGPQRRGTERPFQGGPQRRDDRPGQRHGSEPHPGSFQGSQQRREYHRPEQQSASGSFHRSSQGFQQRRDNRPEQQSASGSFHRSSQGFQQRRDDRPEQQSASGSFHRSSQGFQQRRDDRPEQQSVSGSFHRSSQGFQQRRDDRPKQQSASGSFHRSSQGFQQRRDNRPEQQSASESSRSSFRDSQWTDDKAKHHDSGSRSDFRQPRPESFQRRGYEPRSGGSQGQQQPREKVFPDERKQKAAAPQEPLDESHTRQTSVWESKPSGSRSGPPSQTPQKREPDTTVSGTSKEVTSTDPIPKAAVGKKSKGKKASVADEPKEPSFKKTSPAKGLSEQIETLNINHAPMPLRKQGKNVAHTPQYMLRKFRLEVNYLPITLDIKKSKLDIFHYHVEFNPSAPKALFRPAMEIFLSRHANGRCPAFDGRSNMYAVGSRLPFPNDEIKDTVSVLNPENEREKNYEITVKLADQELNLDSLRQYLHNGSSLDPPQSVLQAVDIALRDSLTGRFIQTGRSFFSRPREFIDLTGGLELWPGHFQSAVLGWKPYLNVDVANKAFYSRQNLVDFLYKIFPRNLDLSRPLMDWQREELRRAIVTFKVEYQIPNNGGVRKYRVAGIGHSAREDSFMYEERRITVAEYFRRFRGYTLQYPDLPPIRTQNESLFPLELCWIASDQPFIRKLNPDQTSSMVRNSAQPPPERKTRIMNTIVNAGFDDNDCLREFGIVVGDQFAQVDAWVLKPPSIEYQNRKEVKVDNGVWRLNNQQFIETSRLRNWVIINTDRKIQRFHIDKLVREFRNVGRGLGVLIEDPVHVNYSLNARNDQDFAREFDQCKGNAVELIVVVMNNSDDCYGKIKRAAELNVGVLTQCLKSRTVERMNPMTATNILLKINAKLNGTNHVLWNAICPSILKQHAVMIVGADVTHPSPGVESVSIAAVAASDDVHGFRYNMTYRLQTSRCEMITDLKEMMKEHLLRYRNKLGKVPEKILYFRDGVSEGQFAQVRHIELTAIREACKELGPNYQPGITFLVVQKRHHTRFFPPREHSDKNNNVLAGTIVDTEITHPTETDFYLVSHQSIKGTARPTKYHLLWDDNDFDLEPLEQLTYYLCYMFARCTRSVSYPAPTYYAHLAAFRCRAWWEKHRFEPGILADAARLKTFQNNRGGIALENSPMFFV